MRCVFPVAAGPWISSTSPRFRAHSGEAELPNEQQYASSDLICVGPNGVATSLRGQEMHVGE